MPDIIKENNLPDDRDSKDSLKLEDVDPISMKSEEELISENLADQSQKSAVPDPVGADEPRYEQPDTDQKKDPLVYDPDENAAVQPVAPQYQANLKYRVGDVEKQFPDEFKDWITSEAREKQA